MRELGEYLQQMREARGLSREEIAKATRINPTYITAIEEGDYASLPPDIYIRGFIKSYGEFLGADIAELLSRYEAEKPKPKARRIFSGMIKQPPPFESPIPKKSYGHKAIVPRRIRLSRGRLIGIVVLFIAAIVLVALLSRRGNGSVAPITNFGDVADSGGVVDKRLATAMTEEDLTQEIRLKLGDINPAWALGRAESLSLAVIARQKTWMLVETDYRRAFKGDIGKNDTMRFSAKNAFFLTMGAPNEMHLMVNGFDLNEWPERKYPLDLDINRGNVLQLLEGSEQIDLPRPPSIIGTSKPKEPSDSTTIEEPHIITRKPGTSIVNPKKGRLPNVNVPPPEGPPSSD